MTAGSHESAPHGTSSTVGNAICRVASILSIPYGYTVTLWCAGAWTVAELGRPSRLDVLLFAAGAVTAFLALAQVGRPHLAAEVPMHVPSVVVANLFPIVAALAGLVVPAEWLDRRVHFLVNGFLATATYIVSVALLIHGANVVRSRREGSRRRRAS